MLFVLERRTSETLPLFYEPQHHHVLSRPTSLLRRWLHTNLVSEDEQESKTRQALSCSSVWHVFVYSNKTKVWKRVRSLKNSYSNSSLQESLFHLSGHGRIEKIAERRIREQSRKYIDAAVLQRIDEYSGDDVLLSSSTIVSQVSHSRSCNVVFSHGTVDIDRFCQLLRRILWFRKRRRSDSYETHTWMLV